VRRILFLLLLTALALGQEAERNLVPNADFDQGAEGAAKIPGWTEVDGLTTFFEQAEGRGRVLRIDTDVNLVEADVRWEEMKLPAADRPAAKPKGATHPPKYDTVGGTTGAKIFSDYLRVEPGMRYRLRVDVKSDAPTVKIFIKGYSEFQGGFRKFYQCYKNIENPEPGWHTYERTFNPTFKSPDVSHIRVMPYAYWPPGNAWVDKVEITRVGPERREGAVSTASLVVNGDFEKRTLTPFTAEGPAVRVERGADGAIVRIDPGGTLFSPTVKVETGKRYVLKLRALPSGAILRLKIEGLVKLSGKWYPLFTKEESVPAESDEWADVEIPFHPSEKSPQVAHVRVTFTLAGVGSAFLDDVAIEPLLEEADEPGRE
jgi:hypothetical protein